MSDTVTPTQEILKKVHAIHFRRILIPDNDLTWTPDGDLTYHPHGGATLVYIPLADGSSLIGISICNPHESFNKKTGFSLATKYAVQGGKQGIRVHVPGKWYSFAELEKLGIERIKQQRQKFWGRYKHEPHLYDFITSGKKK